MALELPEWQVRAYAANVYQKAQESKNKIDGTTRDESKNAAQIGFDVLAPMEGETPTSRLAPTPNHQADHSRRWVYPTGWIFAHQTDDFEKMKQIHDPNHEYTIAGAAAYNRETTRRFATAARGNAAEGEGTLISVALPSGQKIAHGSARFTAAKVIQARTMLDQATGGDRESFGPYYMLYDPDDLRTLLKDSTFTSMDYVTHQSMMDGRPPPGWLGFNWIQTSLLPVIPPLVTNVRFNLAWAKVAMGRGENSGGRSTSVETRPDLSDAMQVLMKSQFNFVRIDDKLVIEIANDLTATP
jgi:Phage capsid protein